MTALVLMPHRFLRWLFCAAGFVLLVFHAPVTSALEWHIEEVDTTGNVGLYNSLALDAFSCCLMM